MVFKGPINEMCPQQFSCTLLPVVFCWSPLCCCYLQTSAACEWMDELNTPRTPLNFSVGPWASLAAPLMGWVIDPSSLSKSRGLSVRKLLSAHLGWKWDLMLRLCHRTSKESCQRLIGRKKRTKTPPTTRTSSNLERVSVHLTEIQIIHFLPLNVTAWDRRIASGKTFNFVREKKIWTCSILLAVHF